MEALIAEQGLATLSALGGKADVEAVGAALAAKASRAELLEMIDARSSELRDETQVRVRVRVRVSQTQARVRRRCVSSRTPLHNPNPSLTLA